MKALKPVIALAAATLLSASAFFTGCSALQSELTPSTPAVTNAVTGVVTPPGPPPAATQLQGAAVVAQEAVPAPYGTLLAALLNLLATGAAAYATFHARQAAVSASSAAQASASASKT